MCLYLCVFNNFDACKYVCKYLYCFVHLQIVVNNKLDLKLTSSLFVHWDRIYKTSFSSKLTNGHKMLSVALHYCRKACHEKTLQLIGPIRKCCECGP
jgi:hypothetical protein